MVGGTAIVNTIKVKMSSLRFGNGNSSGAKTISTISRHFLSVRQQKLLTTDFFHVGHRRNTSLLQNSDQKPKCGVKLFSTVKDNGFRDGGQGGGWAGGGEL